MNGTYCHRYGLMPGSSNNVDSFQCISTVFPFISVSTDPVHSISGPKPNVLLPQQSVERTRAETWFLWVRSGSEQNNRLLPRQPMCLVWFIPHLVSSVFSLWFFSNVQSLYSEYRFLFYEVRTCWVYFLRAAVFSQVPLRCVCVSLLTAEPLARARPPFLSTSRQTGRTGAPAHGNLPDTYLSYLFSSTFWLCCCCCGCLSLSIPLSHALYPTLSCFPSCSLTLTK